MFYIDLCILIIKNYPLTPPQRFPLDINMLSITHRCKATVQIRCIYLRFIAYFVLLIAFKVRVAENGILFERPTALDIYLYIYVSKSRGVK